MLRAYTRPMSFERRTLRSVVLAANALAPVKRSRFLTIPSFFASWITSEAAGPLMAYELADAAVFAARGGLKTHKGAAAVTARLGAAGVLAYLIKQAAEVDDEFGSEIRAFRAPEKLAARPRSDRRGAVAPVFNGGSHRRRTRDVAYVDGAGKANRLDIYEPKDANTSGQPRPIVIYVHGGGWVIGDKREQGIPILNHLSDNGWLCFSANYRLSPKHKAPAHIVDVKKAIAWVRQHAHEYGGDPNFITIIGNSAGGHLCALAALTANDPEFQPGFEDADTSVQAAVPFYGVYDMADRDRLYGNDEFAKFIERVVFGQTAAEAPERFAAYSPVDQIHTDAPPMMIVHGSKDVLVPVEGARLFVDKLRATSKNPVLYVEITGAQHAFDVFASPRTVRTVEWVEEFLAETHERYIGGLDGAGVDAGPPVGAKR